LLYFAFTKKGTGNGEQFVPHCSPFAGFDFPQESGSRRPPHLYAVRFGLSSNPLTLPTLLRVPCSLLPLIYHYKAVAWLENEIQQSYCSTFIQQFYRNLLYFYIHKNFEKYCCNKFGFTLHDFGVEI